VLGGDGVHSTDCSMFTRMSAVSSGLEPKTFRRGAGNQYGYSSKRQFEMQMVDRSSSYYGIDLTRLMPGDFLFFNWRNEFCRVRPYGVGHVALYIGPVKGTQVYVVHAGNPVKKCWINSKYMVGVGRIGK
jgi:cell wall-associated NlpC family hydrolase